MRLSAEAADTRKRWWPGRLLAHAALRMRSPRRLRSEPDADIEGDAKRRATPFDRITADLARALERADEAGDTHLAAMICEALDVAQRRRRGASQRSAVRS